MDEPTESFSPVQVLGRGPVNYFFREQFFFWKASDQLIGTHRGSTTRNVGYPESGVAHFSATPEIEIDPASKRASPDGIIWQAISLANRRLTGCWKSKIIGGDPSCGVNDDRSLSSSALVNDVSSICHKTSDIVHFRVGISGEFYR